MTVHEPAGRWTSVQEIVDLLREACVVLVPVLDRARIPYRDGKAYDQWDAISEALYEQLVVEPLSWALRAPGTLQLPGYDFHLDDYSDTNYLCALTAANSSGSAGTTLAFSGFTSLHASFDAVQLVRLDEQHRAVEDVTLPWSSVTLELVITGSRGSGTVGAIFIPD